MGVALTPIVVKEPIDLEGLRGRALALDGNCELYQFLALIRQRDGTPLHDRTGRVTSHLSGLFYRSTRLIADYGMRLVYVFDGAPRRSRRPRSRSGARSDSATSRRWRRRGRRATSRAPTPSPP